MNMQYFKPVEFREWYDLMSPRLLAMMDVFRHIIDQPVQISLAEGSLGRRLGMDNKSKHNVDQWGECQAVDFFVEGVITEGDARQVVRMAKSLGFTGIGVYPEWKNNYGITQVGFHFDVRPERKMGQPAMWGWVGGDMCLIEVAFREIGAEE